MALRLHPLTRFCTHSANPSAGTATRRAAGDWRGSTGQHKCVCCTLGSERVAAKAAAAAERHHRRAAGAPGHVHGCSHNKGAAQHAAALHSTAPAGCTSSLQSPGSQQRMREGLTSRRVSQIAHACQCASHPARPASQQARSSAAAGAGAAASAGWPARQGRHTCGLPGCSSSRAASAVAACCQHGRSVLPACSQHLLQQVEQLRLLDVLCQLILGHPHVLAVAAAALEHRRALYQLAPARARGGGGGRQAGSEAGCMPAAARPLPRAWHALRRTGALAHAAHAGLRSPQRTARRHAGRHAGSCGHGRAREHLPARRRALSRAHRWKKSVPASPSAACPAGALPTK